MKNILFLLIGLFLIISCSGEDIDGPQKIEPEIIPPAEQPMEQPESPSLEEQIELSGLQRREPVLPPDSHTCYKTGESELYEFVDNVLDGNYITRWNKNPIVRIASNTDDRHTLVVEKAVSLINVSLPSSNRMIINRTPVPPDTDKYDVPDGEIWIEFVGDACVYDYVGNDVDLAVRVSDNFGNEAILNLPEPKRICDHRQEWFDIREEVDTRCNSKEVAGCASLRYQNSEIVASHVLIRGMDQTCYDDLLITIVHELLHGIGITGHIESTFTKSVMRTGIWGNCRFELPAVDWFLFVEKGKTIEMDVMYPIDRDALKAVYSLKNGDSPYWLGVRSDMCK